MDGPLQGRCARCLRLYNLGFPIHPLGYCPTCAGSLSNATQIRVQAEEDQARAEIEPDDD